MKIKVKEMSYNQVLALPVEKHIRPQRPNILFRTLLKLLSLPELWATHFTWEKEGMERLGKGEPCLILMNHSSFIDLKIAASMLYPKPFNKKISAIKICKGKERKGKEDFRRFSV